MVEIETIKKLLNSTVVEDVVLGVSFLHKRTEGNIKEMKTFLKECTSRAKVDIYLKDMNVTSWGAGDLRMGMLNFDVFNSTDVEPLADRPVIRL